MGCAASAPASVLQATLQPSSATDPQSQAGINSSPPAAPPTADTAAAAITSVPLSPETPLQQPPHTALPPPSSAGVAPAKETDLQLQQLSADASERGVPVRWVLDVFAKRVEEAKGAGELDRITTREVVETVIIPQTVKHKCPYVQLVPGSRSPDYLVVHAWDRPFNELLTSLRRRFEAATAKDDAEQEVVVWVDIFAVNQQSTTSGDKAHGGNDEVSVMEVMTRVVERTRGTLLVLDANGQCLKRAWCLSEIRLAAAAATTTENGISASSSSGVVV
eukprot:CAMPEP_0177758432 /NCGR_PEP_ID=MMETSP0491_2-20121128/4181_1 /TAXON_ID=63592 /ORGANISM="Tetraselmis chuii, Strain PLY429" /LENGTH=276 /DNA_ID=CAMNT_0019274165 /DNA_START=46 /DNA_END=874 /DNA_ORIENTATION=+